MVSGRSELQNHLLDETDVELDFICDTKYGVCNLKLSWIVVHLIGRSHHTDSTKNIITIKYRNTNCMKAFNILFFVKGVALTLAWFNASDNMLGSFESCLMKMLS